jgi:30S ribosomal protein S31
LGSLFYFCISLLQKRKIIMGRGDKKTAKGKRFKGSFGKSRPANAKKTTVPKVEVEVKAS